MTLRIFNIQKFCLHDGPGIRTTVFLKGCPLGCLWCHNPESQNPEPELLFVGDKCTDCGLCLGLCGARSMGIDRTLRLDRTKCVACGRCEAACPRSVNALRGYDAETDEILCAVARDIPFYETSGGGMTVSGGEPAAQPAGVLELIEKVRERGISCAMETAGVGSADFYRRAAELGCLFLFDLKGIDPEKHLRNTGVGPEKIHSSLDMLISRGADIVIRMPLVPGYNDSKEDLRLMADFLRERRGGFLYAEIMPYHSLGVEKLRGLGREIPAPIPDGRAFADRWREALAPSGTEIRVSGT